jgi:hypothetical protein
MDLRSLQSKRIENGKLILTEPTILFKSNSNTIGKFIVDTVYAGRIDLISLHVYGSASYADYILKYNGISNPFSIEEGDVLEIPYADTILATWKDRPNIKSEDSNYIRDKFMNTKRLTEADQKRIDYLKRKAAEYPNGASEILPPNVLKTGKTNITIKNGIITINGPSEK